MSHTCRGCDGTCCTGVGSDSCTCPPSVAPAPAPSPVLEALLRAAGRPAVSQGPDGSYLVQCPAHGDERPSLAFKQLGGGAVIHCHAGCRPEEVLAALGMSVGQLAAHRQD